MIFEENFEGGREWFLIILRRVILGRGYSKSKGFKEGMFFSIDLKVSEEVSVVIMDWVKERVVGDMRWSRSGW